MKPCYCLTRKYKKSYRFRVAAVNALGTGPWTSTQTVHLRTLAQDAVLRALGELNPKAENTSASVSGAADVGAHHSAGVAAAGV